MIKLYVFCASRHAKRAWNFMGFYLKIPCKNLVFPTSRRAKRAGKMIAFTLKHLIQPYFFCTSRRAKRAGNLMVFHVKMPCKTLGFPHPGARSAPDFFQGALCHDQWKLEKSLIPKKTFESSLFPLTHSGIGWWNWKRVDSEKSFERNCSFP